MKRRDIINELKICAIGFAIGTALFGSFLFFGLRVKAACEPFSGLLTIPRCEIADMALSPAYEPQASSEVVESSTIPAESSTLDLLAALVWAEAGDQDFIGQRIVADCVMNRVRSGEWPNSVEGVIYQPGQFSVVANGRLEQGFYNATAENYEAARLALSGDHYDTQVIYFSMYYCANGAFAYQHGDHYIGY